MDDTDHWGGVECDTCTKEFGSQDAANQHMSAVGHWRRYRAPRASMAIATAITTTSMSIATISTDLATSSPDKAIQVPCTQNYQDRFMSRIARYVSSHPGNVN